VVAVILGVVFHRYRARRIPLARPVKSLFSKPHPLSLSQPMPLEQFEEKYKEKKAGGQIAKEFERVQEFSAKLNQTKSRYVGQMEKNLNRNRFVDIIPYDDNYVRLSEEQGLPPSDYINASYIEGLEGVGKVIVTQGPKQNTMTDFWRMVLEHKIGHIIMLTNCQEGGRVKCAQYWPPNGQMLHFDDLSLFTVDEKEVHQGLFLRKVELTMMDRDGEEEEVHVVRQLHLTNWPDHGVPDHLNSLLAFLRVARTFRDQEHSLVHCSAGVGRTGTYLALLSLAEQMKGGSESVDVLKTVLALRKMRPKMVQTLEQYDLIHRCLVSLSDDVSGGRGSVRGLGDVLLDAGVDNFGFEHVKI